MSLEAFVKANSRVWMFPSLATTVQARYVHNQLQLCGQHRTNAYPSRRYLAAQLGELKALRSPLIRMFLFVVGKVAELTGMTAAGLHSKSYGAPNGGLHQHSDSNVWLAKACLRISLVDDADDQTVAFCGKPDQRPAGPLRFDLSMRSGSMYNMDGKLSGPQGGVTHGVSGGGSTAPGGQSLSLIQGFSMAGTGTVRMDVDEAITIALRLAETRYRLGEFGSLDAAQLAVAAEQPTWKSSEQTAPSVMASIKGNLSVAGAGKYSANLGRIALTMEERGELGGESDFEIPPLVLSLIHI